ncbi:MAG: NADH-quinone oxidoreductase subunit NuoF [Candidatus Omnitrophota bacterium]|nr:MAG: NADH-quinone oxidoreductase subunit NuoF [Candidatus Omnitrophota bacterium]
MKIVLRNIHKQGYKGDIESYLKEQGYTALKKALTLSPSQIIEEVKKARLLGRGGAGFPCGVKWEFVYREKEFPKYVVCNADEGEPGTFKDRLILENDPHLLIEAMIICGFAIGAEEGFIYLRGEYFKAYQILERALEEARSKGFLGEHILNSNFSFHIRLYRGAGAYICGEETALLDSLEGKKGQSRVKPPFPTFVGFKNKPTVLNNVETFANITQILLNGGEWFAQIGSSHSPGTKLYCLSGDVKKPGVYELPTNISLNQLIEEFGGGVEGELKAVLPGGVSSSLLTPDKLDVIMDYFHLQEVGSMLGSGAVIVINKDRCMVDLAKRCAEFFDYESCGKCVPCREGTKRAREILVNITRGKGELKDLELLKELAEVMFDTSRCGLGQSALNPVRSSIEKFSQEFEEHILKKRCPLGICSLC